MSSAPVAILKSGDLPATVRWYRSAGFEVDREGTTLCEVSRDGLVLRFLSGATPWDGPANLTGCFYVHVPDVDAVAGQIDDPVRAQWGVEQRDWGSRELVLQDPDGYFITFTAPQRAADAGLRCWCCDGEFGEVGLIRLGSRPEVTICLSCARHVKRRAAAREDEHRWTPQGALRRGIDRVRGTVIERGWHERGPLGVALRGIDRFLP